MPRFSQAPQFLIRQSASCSASPTPAAVGPTGDFSAPSPRKRQNRKKCTNRPARTAISLSAVRASNG
eukprot:6199173-Pleurochrysis_carterae.AAC.2